MAFLPSLSPTDLRHYHRVVTYSMQVRSHFDVLVWLQGDMQHYLPHDIMIAAWGNFSDGAIQHDIISTMAGVRSKNSNPETLTPLLWAMNRVVTYSMQVRSHFTCSYGCRVTCSTTPLTS
jgi:hypothetical protein